MYFLHQVFSFMTNIRNKTFNITSSKFWPPWLHIFMSLVFKFSTTKTSNNKLKHNLFGFYRGFLMLQRTKNKEQRRKSFCVFQFSWESDQKKKEESKIRWENVLLECFAIKSKGFFMRGKGKTFHCLEKGETFDCLRNEENFQLSTENFIAFILNPLSPTFSSRKVTHFGDTLKF